MQKSNKGEYNTKLFIKNDIRGYYDYDNFIYLGPHVKSEIKCQRCGDRILITPANLRTGKGCRSCNLKETLARNKELKLEEHLLKCHHRHGDKFDYTAAVYYGAEQPIVIVCRIHDYKFKSILENHLRTDSGGCRLCAKEKIAKLRTTHGLCGTRIYNIWSDMKQRCLNENDPAYLNYGGRGIDIYDRWINDFEEFYCWSMENGYADDLVIDRIDNNKGYHPDNCRFVTPQQNANNTRHNVRLRLFAREHTKAEWCRIFNRCPKLLYQRLTRGWGIARALTEPVNIRDQSNPKKIYRLLEGLWSNKKGCCNNPRNKDYKYYGGRGIKMCPEWENDYKCFEGWCLANGYKEDLHLHRKNNDLGYSPENCEFTTKKENARNKRNNRFLTLNGVTGTQSYWAEKTGLKRETISGRLRRGYTDEEALMIPTGVRKKDWNGELRILLSAYIRAFFSICFVRCIVFSACL